MANRWTNTLTRVDVTPKGLFMNRRQLIVGAAGLGVANIAGMARAQDALVPNTIEEISSYNNYYEFGTGKEDPAANAGAMRTSPWSIKVDGLVDNPGDYALADLLDGLTVEERIYRFRCVEAWSMIVPWNGVELVDVLAKVGVQSAAKFVAFETDMQPDVMEGVNRGVIPFPYVEGLRIDEAMHPLTLCAVGMYGRWLKTKLFFATFPMYKKATFKRQKSYMKSERLR